MITFLLASTLKASEAYAIPWRKPFRANWVALINSGSLLKFVTRAVTTKFLSSVVRSLGSTSSQTRERVSRDANFTSNWVELEFALRLGIKSRNSFLGISIAAIEAMSTATCLLTLAKGVARTARRAVFIVSLSVPARFIQKFSNLWSYKVRIPMLTLVLLVIKFLIRIADSILTLS